MKNLIGLCVFLIVFSGKTSAGGWLDPFAALELFRQTITGEKDHVTGGIQEIGQKTEGLQQYEIVITNSTDTPITYIFNGKPATIEPHDSINWNVQNTNSKIKIKFNNRHGQQVSYGIGKGRYIFKWDNGVLAFFDDTAQTSVQSQQPVMQPMQTQQICVNVDSRQGWQRFNFSTAVRSIVGISGSWSVDTRNYQPVGASGHSGSAAQALAPYNLYKYDQQYPFGALLVDNGQGYFWFQKLGSVSSNPITGIDMRINDADNALGDNGGILKVCFK